MSRYGQLFEEASMIRRRLVALLPGRLTGNYTSADARRIVREDNPLIDEVDKLSDEWDRIEEKMRETDD